MELKASVQELELQSAGLVARVEEAVAEVRRVREEKLVQQMAAIPKGEAGSTAVLLSPIFEFPVQYRVNSEVFSLSGYFIMLLCTIRIMLFGLRIIYMGLVHYSVSDGGWPRLINP